MNQLFHGDNLTVLRQRVKDESVDLIYLDPPFKSDRNYAAGGAGGPDRRRTPRGSAKRVPVFEDTWQWDARAATSLQQAIALAGNISKAISALHGFLGESDLMAYLVMMALRLDQLHRVLKSTGTMYLHCDSSASHYLKMLLDAVFGDQNMRNEIVWCYRGGGVPKRDFVRKHDTIFRYSKTDDYFFDVDAVRIPYSDDVISSSPSRYDKSYRANKVYAGYRPNPSGKHPEDWWPMQAILPSSGERLGYPTQKPEALLERIIRASSRVGDLVLDPFCGCGTALVVADRLGRQSCGIDISGLACEITARRWKEATGRTVKPRRAPQAKATVAPS